MSFEIPELGVCTVLTYDNAFTCKLTVLDILNLNRKINMILHRFSHAFTVAFCDFEDVL